MTTSRNPLTLSALGLATCLALLPLPATAGDGNHPNHTQGFEPQKVYSLGDLESVNLFNGNLALTLPIGQTYPVGGDFSYGLTLTYSGNVWEWEEVDIHPDPPYLKAKPRLRSNAGLGWLLSLGRIYRPQDPELNGVSPWAYESPDGSLHRFWSSLHPGGPTETDYHYTQDGTYLRIYAPDGPGEGYDPTSYQVEFPNGHVHDFDISGRLVQMGDQFGNSLTVTYPNSSYGGIQDWRLADSHGRVHYVRFQPGANGPVVDRVELESFGGGTAVWEFTTDETNIPRGWTTPSAVDQPNYGVSRLVDVDLLTEILQPDGSTYEMPVWPGYDLGPASGTASTSGHLLQIRLPTGGHYEYLWRQYYFPARSGRIQPLQSLSGGVSTQNPLTQSTGLWWRKHTTRNNSLVGQWTYEPEQDTNVPAVEHRVKVTDPLGHYTWHYFSAYVDDDDGTTTEPPGWQEGDYGLPFSRNQPVSGRFISSKTYRSTGALFQTTFVNYERDDVGPSRANPRLTRQRVYHKSDSGGAYTGFYHSGWDGVGHHRTTTTEGTLTTGGNVRTTFTNYNPGASSNYQPPVPTTQNPNPWLLNTFTETRVTENNTSAERNFCFDGSTGVLKRERVLENTGGTGGASPSSSDLVTVYTRDSSGNVSKEEIYGSDVQSVGTGSLCSLSLPGTPRYRMNHTWQYGTLKTSQVSGVVERSVNRLIDQATGRVSRSYDSALVETDYSYDAMGRLTWVKPEDDAWQQMIYRHGDVYSARVQVLRKANGGGATRTEERYVFSDLGQLYNHQTLMPDGTWSDQVTFYDEAGNVKSVSTRGDVNSKTQYLSYDPMGRATTIRPPDSTSGNGYAHDVDLLYKGVREVQRTVSVGTTWSSGSQAVTETPSTTTELYDGQGRLVQVSEPANPDGTDATTFYAYDEGNRLSSVTQTGKSPSGASNSQTRKFEYDQRGFLTRERHPEKGSSGNGWVNYYEYDVTGNPRRRVDGSHDLRYTYDAARRVTQVSENGGRPLQQFTYATSNGTGDLRRGKLQTAMSYNYPTIGANSYEITIQEDYEYGGLQGRVSQRDTVVVITANPGSGSTPGPADTFRQTWVWNDLGDVASQTYPQCTSLSLCSAPDPRTVSYGYTRGRLTSVPGVIDSITYLPNGQVNVIDHSNDTTDVWRQDSANLPRPSKIEGRTGSSTGTVFWSTGQFVYDGAGNITKMGKAHVTYDKASRVTSGTLYLGPGATGGGTDDWSVTYDGFGNIQSLSTVGTATRSTPTSLSTNRLTGSVSYDSAGNMTSWNGAIYSFDALDRMWRMTNGSQDWRHMYTADGERLFSFRANGGPSRWILRDLDGKILREYENDAGTWSVVKDYVYRGTHAAAIYTSEPYPQDEVHFHTDHLGSVRALTNSAGTRFSYHLFYPFGEEATSITQDAGRLKFTGHERDLGDFYSAADDLDYMHARYYNPQLGRFLGVDPAFGPLSIPQAWNRYSYVLGNPIKYYDPFGLFPCPGMPEIDCQDAITVTTEGYNVVGYESFLAFGTFLGSLFDGGASTGFGLLDVETARSFYDRGFEDAVASGNDGTAYVYYAIDEFFVPDSQGELGVELGMAIIPIGKLGKLGRIANKALGSSGRQANTLLVRLAKRAGFHVKPGGSHLKVVNPKTGEVITMIPHSPHGSGTIRDIVQKILNAKG